MSTHCAIGYQDSKGKIKGIYSHCDGYPDDTGVILRDHYSDPKKIKELIKLGDISVLDENIGDKISFEDYEGRRAKRQCRSYKRDRGEKGTSAKTFNSIQDFLNFFDFDYNYIYIEKENKWVFLRNKNVEMIDITKAIETIK